VATHEPARVTSSPRRARCAKLRGIYVIVNENGRDPLRLARAAIAAGVTVLQYRAKSGVVGRTLRALRAMAGDAGALLLVNDDAEAALRFDCDGVHLGPGDAGFADPAAVRATLRDRLVGLSCGTLDETLAANAHDVDYLGVGSVFATASKADAGAPIGIQTLRRIVTASRFPVAAIGGIGETGIADVARSGAAMAAVISAVAGAGDPDEAARRLVRAWEDAGA
jgi:thiamine-phosphate pyrophosphorylase